MVERRGTLELHTAQSSPPDDDINDHTTPRGWNGNAGKKKHEKCLKRSDSQGKREQVEKITKGAGGGNPLTAIVRMAKNVPPTSHTTSSTGKATGARTRNSLWIAKNRAGSRLNSGRNAQCGCPAVACEIRIAQNPGSKRWRNARKKARKERNRSEPNPSRVGPSLGRKHQLSYHTWMDPPWTGTPHNLREGNGIRPRLLLSWRNPRHLRHVRSLLTAPAAQPSNHPHRHRPSAQL